MKNKILVMALLCMLFTTIFGNTKAAYAAFASDYYEYDEQNFTINKIDLTTGEVTNSYLLDDVSVSRIKAGYGYYISIYVNSGNHYLCVYTLPKDVLLAMGKYGVEGYSGTKYAVKPYTFSFEEIPSSELDMRVVYTSGGNFSEVELKVSGETLVNIDWVTTSVNSATTLGYYMIHSTLNIYYESSGAFNLLHLGEEVPDAWAETFTEVAITAELGKIYAEPSVNSAYVCGASAGTIIKIGKSTVVDGIIWFKAKLENRHGIYEGYIQASDIIAGGISSGGSSSGSSGSVDTETGKATIIDNGVSVYEDMSAQTEKLYTLGSGDIVYVLEKNDLTDGSGTWYYVKYYNENLAQYCTGYLYGDHIEYDADSGFADNDVDLTLDDISNNISQLKDGMSEILSFITSIPKIIGSIFSFLPDWCLNILGISVSLSAIMIVIKIIRG